MPGDSLERSPERLDKRPTYELLNKFDVFGLEMDGMDKPDFILSNPNKDQVNALLEFAYNLKTKSLISRIEAVEHTAIAITLKIRDHSDVTVMRGTDLYEAINYAKRFKEKLREEKIGELRQARERGLEGDVADSTNETSEVEMDVPEFDMGQFNIIWNKFLGLRTKLTELDKLGEKEKEKRILEMRRSVIEVKYLIRSIYDVEAYALNGNLRTNDQGEDLFFENPRESSDENDAINLTQRIADIGELEAELNLIKIKIEKDGQIVDSPLYKDLEKRKQTISPREFLQLDLKERLKLISNIKSWDDLKENSLIVFDFGDNAALERQIGLGDLMPPKIRQISLGDRVFTRRASQGFYDGGKYLAIFDGTKVSITAEEEDYSAEKEYKQKFVKDYPADAELPEVGAKIERQEIAEIARDFGVDAYLLEAIFLLMKGAGGHDDHYEFLHMAARYVQNAEVKYELKENAIENGNYSAEFIVYALDRFSLFTNYTGQNNQSYDVIRKYADLKGVEIRFDEAALDKERESTAPQSYGSRHGGNYDGETYYPPENVFEATESMKEQMRIRLSALKESLSGMPANISERAIRNAQKIYKMMIDRLGRGYKEVVNIDGWRIRNSCTGNIMKVMQPTDFRLLRGRQGRKGKHASKFYWGAYGDGTRDSHEFNRQRRAEGKRGIVGFGYLRSMVPDDSYMIQTSVTPGNVDAVVGKYLKPGECAPAGLAFGHAIWIYREPGPSGKIMVHHSGADYRPARIPASGEMPPGYEHRGNYYCKKRILGSKSKVNVVPLSFFLARAAKRDVYSLKFVPLRNLVAGQEGMPPQIKDGIS